MTPLAALAPLLRALMGGRDAARTTGTLTLGSGWNELLAQLDLPPTTFQDVLASRSLKPHFHYRHFSRPKKDGGRRALVEPDEKLKRIQREILVRYFKSSKPHKAAVAYRAKKSIGDHVWPHTGADLLITADIEDFFPATHAGRVEDWWRARVREKQARLLTLLTTYDGGLPQGAPTSPALSNLVNVELDERLSRRSAAASALYTRYCDDMVFSWRPGTLPPSDFENGVRATLHEFGYILHPKKGWQVHRRRDEPEITGVILTRHGRVRLPERLQRWMRVLRQSADPYDLQRLAGYEGYEAMLLKRRKETPARKTMAESGSRDQGEHAAAQWDMIPPRAQASGREDDNAFPEEGGDEDIPF